MCSGSGWHIGSGTFLNALDPCQCSAVPEKKLQEPCENSLVRHGTKQDVGILPLSPLLPFGFAQGRSDSVRTTGLNGLVRYLRPSTSVLHSVGRTQSGGQVWGGLDEGESIEGIGGFLPRKSLLFGISYTNISRLFTVSYGYFAAVIHVGERPEMARNIW